MTYTIGQAAKKMGLTAHTLRYYDKEGLLPFVDRTRGGARVFTDVDLEWLSLIECLKNTGMPIRETKKFIDWYVEGDSTLQQRYDMFLERKAEIERQMSVLQKYLEMVEFKCWYYKTALDAGTESVHGRNPVPSTSPATA